MYQALEKKLKQTSQRIFHILKKSFLPAWYVKWTCVHYDEAENHVLCIISKNINDHGMLNNVKVDDSFVKAEYSNWKNSRSADKGYQKQKSSKCDQTSLQRLVEILKTTQDVSTTLKINFTEKQFESKTSLLNVLLCLCYLARQGLPFRGHEDDKHSPLNSS